MKIKTFEIKKKHILHVITGKCALFVDKNMIVVNNYIYSHVAMVGFLTMILHILFLPIDMISFSFSYALKKRRFAEPLEKVP